MKKYLKAPLTGIIVTLVIVLIMLTLTMDFQILLFLGFAIFFIAGYLNSNNENHYLLTAGFILIFYVTFFVLIILSELPDLWYYIPFHSAAVLFGIFFKNHMRKTAISAAIIVSLMLFVAIEVIPDDIQNRITKERFDQLPEFDIHDINGKTINSRNLEGKVVVLDFFGTWCRPCIQELKELDEIKDSFNENDVVFYVINADQGGDSPEKFDAFIKKNDYTFNYAYDQDSRILKKLKMHQLGVPTLLIIDKNQNIRLQHVGYNTAEVNFKSLIIDTINKLNS